jgi:hypothetical protein
MGRKVKDVMTGEVICARPSMPYKELVRLLATRRVSAVPVVDAERRVLGVVSESDLLLKHEQPTDAFQRLLLAGRRRRRARLKARGGTAAELMSWPVITIGPEAEVAEAGQAAAQAAHRAAAGDRRLRPAGRHCQPLRCVEDLPSPRQRHPTRRPRPGDLRRPGPGARAYPGPRP